MRDQAIGATAGQASLSARKVALVVAALVALCLLAFGASLGGEFVYDDNGQVVSNRSIQDSRLYPAALTADVWAFKGSGDEVRSAYWRPTFVAWLIANFRFFSRNATGWHAANLALHLLVCMLAWLLARRLGYAEPAAFAIAALFAVHPAHVESVAWVSGAPDLLMAGGAVGALLLQLRAGRKLSWTALALFALAQGSKEAAVGFGLLVWAMFSLRIALPYFAVSGVYLALRSVVLSGFTLVFGSQATWIEQALSLPSALAFYLRQTLFPLWIGPSYPQRPVGPAEISLETFVLPLAIVCTAVYGVYRLARVRPRARIGAALFLVPLAPALYIRGFVPEQIVHDRYLCLPLLGALLLLAEAVEWAGPSFRRPAAVAAACAGLLLLFQSRAYTRVWLTDAALWEAAVQSDPNSALNRTEYARTLMDQGRLTEARKQLDQALAIRPITAAYLHRAEIALRLRNYRAAQQDLERVLAVFPDHFGAYERLAMVYEGRRDLQRAVQVLREARDKIPARACTLTDKLAVVLVESGDRAAARRELESVVDTTDSSLDPYCALSLYHLALLDRDAGRPQRARELFQRFLTLTDSSLDPQFAPARVAARRAVTAF